MYGVHIDVNLVPFWEIPSGDRRAAFGHVAWEAGADGRGEAEAFGDAGSEVGQLDGGVVLNGIRQLLGCKCLRYFGYQLLVDRGVSKDVVYDAGNGIAGLLRT